MLRIQELPEGTERKEEIPVQTVSPAELLRKAVDERWGVYKRQRIKCEHGKVTAVHEFRVSIRRLVAATDFLLDLVPDAEAERTRKKLKKQLTRLSALRDAQVQRAALEKLLPEYPGVEPLIEKLRRREKRMGKEIAQTASKPKKETLHRALVRLKKNLHEEFGSSNTALLRALMTSALDAAFRRVLSRRDAMRPAKIATIHNTRLAFKRFRYLLELLDGILPEIQERTLEESRKIQSCMGAIHDLELLLETIEDFEWRGSASVADSMRVRRELKSRRRTLIAELIATVKGIDGLWSVPESSTA